jgi:hypothetical protein
LLRDNLTLWTSDLQDGKDYYIILDLHLYWLLYIYI